MGKSWKTSLGGFGAILSVIAKALIEFSAGGIASVDFSVLIAGMSGGIGLLSAKDSDVTGGTKQQ